MKKRAILPLLGAMTVLILDSRCAAQSATDALNLCIQTLIPGLFPMLVISSMLVPHLSGISVPGLARLFRVPEGSEGFLLLGCAGGFPVGAACIVQAVESGALRREDARRMLGISSFCGPAFLFGIIGPLFSFREAALIFLIQLQTAFLTALLLPPASGAAIVSGRMKKLSLGDGLKRASASMLSVCSWVILASVGSGFLRRWLAPFLPEPGAVLLTGILELTTGIFALDPLIPSLRFILCAAFVCFGGISVLLQIGGLAAGAEVPMTDCVIQKTVQGLLGALMAAGVVALGPCFLLVGAGIPAAKIAVEISKTMVYNGPRKEGI